MNKGILLLFLSAYRKGNAITYQVEGSDGTEIYDGIETNDAPIKYLIHHALTQGDRIEKVICIVTEKVKKDESYKLFQQMVRGYIEQNNELKTAYKGTEISFCEVNYNENEELTTERAFLVYSQISDALFSEHTGNVYIDYTGGMRDTSFLMTVIIRYLEYHNFKCRKIVYSNWENKTIQTIDCVYNLFTLINAVDQFVRTGNAEQLELCYQKEDDNETKKLLQLIVRFSRIMSLCDVKKIDEILPEIGKGLRDYGKDKNMNSLYLEMFADMTEMIRKKLYIKDDASLEYPDLIRWCLDNNMIQQALTLYVEKMPNYYYKEKLLTIPEDLKSAERGYTRETTAFYTRLFDDQVKDRTIEQFSQELKSLDTKIEGFSLNHLLNIKKKLNRDGQIAVDRLVRFLRMNYENGTGKRKAGSAPLKPYGTAIADVKSGAGFINMVSNNSVLLHYFVYNSPSKYQEMNVGTQEKKVLALSRVKNGSSDISESRIKREQLYQMMKYYCALKMIRNKINHASEAELTTDEKRAIEQLEKNHGLSMEVEFENIRTMIKCGLEAHK